MSKRKSAIVPRAVRLVKFAAVVPACAIACGGPDPILGLGNEFVVAACCFGVADVTFSDALRPPPSDAPTEAAPTDDASDAADAPAEADAQGE